MKFKSRVKLVAPRDVQDKQDELARAKKLFLEAFQILSHDDKSLMKEAESFLKKVED